MLKIFLLLFFIVASCNCMKWINWSVDKGDVPPNAVVAGVENDHEIYVVRGKHADGLYPGKFMPDKKEAFASYNRKDIPFKNFELLTSDNDISWSKDPKDGRKLVKGGYSVKGDNLNICRIPIAGSLIPGRLQDRICYISFRGFEKQRKQYEVLKYNNQFN